MSVDERFRPPQIISWWVGPLRALRSPKASGGPKVSGSRNVSGSPNVSDSPNVSGGSRAFRGKLVSQSQPEFPKPRPSVRDLARDS